MEKTSFLFICQGNTFRSFWAEQIFGGLTRNYTTVSSAGLQTNLSGPADSLAIATLYRFGYSYMPSAESAHERTTLTNGHLRKFMFLVPMEVEMVNKIRTFELSSNNRLETLGSLAGEPDTEIPDPNTLSLEEVESEYYPPSGIAKALAKFLGKPEPEGWEIGPSRKELGRIENRNVDLLSPTFQEIERLCVLATIRLINQEVLPNHAANQTSPAYRRYRDLFKL